MSLLRGWAAIAWPGEYAQPSPRATSPARGARGGSLDMFAALPLLALPVLFYNALALTAMPQGFRSAVAQDRLAEQLFAVPIASGGAWPVTLGDLLVFASLLILFIE